MRKKASRVLQHYSLGVQRVPLEDLGVSPVNRNLSGAHAHKLGRRIVSVEGFVRFRYQNGWAHEPNPDDPLGGRNTNKGAGATSLLPEVPEVPLKGSFAKTHLMAFLQCLKWAGCFGAARSRKCCALLASTRSRSTSSMECSTRFSSGML